MHKNTYIKIYEIPVLHLFSELGKFWKYSLWPKFENQNILYIAFIFWEELGSVAWNNIEISWGSISLWDGQRKVQPKTYTSLTATCKPPNLNLWMNWQKLSPNLSFTVENKMRDQNEIWSN